MDIMDKFCIEGRVAVITGGGGLLGRQHAEAVIEGRGIPVLVDIAESAAVDAVDSLKKKYGSSCTVEGYAADITKREEMEKVAESLLKKYGHIDILINNAANNPKVEVSAANMRAARFENFTMEMWMDDLSVGLTGALICSQVFGAIMAEQGKGVILNISSDLGIIAPDQRIYRRAGLREDEQMVKPVTYSVIKHGLIGLTKYLATYYADKGVRANTLCPSGVFNGQNDEFLSRLTSLIPMGRMALKDEYKGSVLYMVSDAGSYMTGSTLIVDGGRTCW